MCVHAGEYVNGGCNGHFSRAIIHQTEQRTEHTTQNRGGARPTGSTFGHGFNKREQSEGVTRRVTIKSTQPEEGAALQIKQIVHIYFTGTDADTP